MTTTIDYSPADVGGTRSQVAMLLGNPSGAKLAGYGVFTRSAAISYALGLALDAELLLSTAGVSPSIDQAGVTQQLTQQGATIDKLPVLGGQEGLAVTAAQGSAPSAKAAGLHYLAAMSCIRQLVLGSWKADSVPAADVAMAGELAQQQGQVGLIPAVAWYVVIGVGVVGAAAWAWVKHDDAVQAGKVAIEVARITKAAQVQASIAIAQMQIQAGQAVSVPEIVTQLGQVEAVDHRYLPIAAGVGLAGLAGLAALGK